MYGSYLLDNLTGARSQPTPLTYIILLQADGLFSPPPFPSSPTSLSHPLCLKPVAGCFCRYVVLRYGDRRIAGTAAGWLSWRSAQRASERAGGRTGGRAIITLKGEGLNRLGGGVSIYWELTPNNDNDYRAYLRALLCVCMYKVTKNLLVYGANVPYSI